MHKKLNVETQAKRKARRVVKQVRAPTGITLDKMVSMRKTVVAKKTVDAAAAAGPVRQAAVKEAKDKAKAKAAAAKATRAAQPKAAAPAAKSHGGKGR
jgi:hypothetical protein